jgi:hypothetical protein
MYRHDTESRLERLGVPHFRLESRREGSAYRLAIPAADLAERTRTVQLLATAGIVSVDSGKVVEAFFHIEEEAQKALASLAREGLHGGYGKLQGSVPVWTVFAGPFTLEEAKRMQPTLEAAGLETYLRRKP